jgi:hypothetical protein
MNRLDRGQFVEAIGVAPSEEAMARALVRGAGLVVGDRAEEIGEAFRGAGPTSAISAGTTIGRPNGSAVGRNTGASADEPASAVTDAFDLDSWSMPPRFKFLVVV